MKISSAQFERISGLFPVQRGNVKTDNHAFIEAILYMTENGCKWRALPREFGKWQTIYKKFSRWAKNGVMQKIFAALQAEAIIAINVEILALDSTVLQSPPQRSWRFKKLGRQSRGKSRGGWNTKLHVVSADDKVVLEIHLSGGECHDAPEGRKSIAAIGGNFPAAPFLMDKAYEGHDTRELALANNHDTVVPKKSNRKDPWEYDAEKYKKRNVVERLFRRLKEFRKIFTRYDKTDVMYMAFVQFALMIIWIK
jgi:transposase